MMFRICLNGYVLYDTILYLHFLYFGFGCSSVRDIFSTPCELRYEKVWVFIVWWMGFLSLVDGL